MPGAAAHSRAAPCHGTGPAPAARGSCTGPGQQDRAPQAPSHPHGPRLRQAQLAVGSTPHPTLGWGCRLYACCSCRQPPPNPPHGTGCTERNQPTAPRHCPGKRFGSAACPKRCAKHQQLPRVYSVSPGICRICQLHKEPISVAPASKLLANMVYQTAPASERQMLGSALASISPAHVPVRPSQAAANQRVPCPGH